jgi:hypothetical protein
MKRYITLSVLVIIVITLFFLNACVYVVRHPYEHYQYPPNMGRAQIYINHEYIGQTPLKVKFEPDTTYEIEFIREGYPTKSITITKPVGDGVVVLDVIYTMEPVLVNPETGAVYTIEQEQVDEARKIPQ